MTQSGIPGLQAGEDVSVPRLHCPGELAAGQALEIQGERAHYLRHVLRLREGSVALVYDTRWRFYPEETYRSGAGESSRPYVVRRGVVLEAE